MIDGMVMILFAVILFLVAVFVWAYKDQQYVEREIEWSKGEQQIVILLGELVERHYNVMECIDNKIESADKLRKPILKELKKEIEDKNDNFHIKIEKITKEM